MTVDIVDLIESAAARRAARDILARHGQDAARRMIRQATAPVHAASGRVLWDAHPGYTRLATTDGHTPACITRAECACGLATELPDVDYQL